MGDAEPEQSQRTASSRSRAFAVGTIQLLATAPHRIQNPYQMLLQGQEYWFREAT